jgi:bifunctional polynucleotide phosphatase/kinase
VSPESRLGRSGLLTPVLLRASGKTSFFKKHFAPRGYEHINQDLMGRREKCLIAAEASLASGKSVVIGEQTTVGIVLRVDNTNRNRETRAIWVSLASRLHTPIRSV